jgi:hypothetical protein
MNRPAKPEPPGRMLNLVAFPSNSKSSGAGRNQVLNETPAKSRKFWFCDYGWDWRFSGPRRRRAGPFPDILQSFTRTNISHVIGIELLLAV